MFVCELIVRWLLVCQVVFNIVCLKILLIDSGGVFMECLLEKSVFWSYYGRNNFSTVFAVNL